MSSRAAKPKRLQCLLRNADDCRSLSHERLPRHRRPIDPIRDGKPTAHCFDFLRWAVEVHRPYWLTTRDARGEHAGIIRAFRHAIGSEPPSEIEALLRAVRPTRWSGTKISGIDLASDFVWIDDAPLAVEVESLRARGWLNRLIVVDTDDALLRAIDVIGARQAAAP